LKFEKPKKSQKEKMLNEQGVICLSSDEEFDDAQQATSFCVKCGPVSKPHICKGGKVMRRPTRPRQESAAAKRAKESDQQYRELFGSDSSDDEAVKAGEGAAKPKAAAAEPEGAAAALLAASPSSSSSAAHSLLSNLLSEHTQLTTALAQRDGLISKTQQDADNAQKEVVRLRSELSKKDSELKQKDGELAKVNKALGDEKKKPRAGKGKMPAVASTSMPDTKGIYTALISNVMTAYRTKEAALIKKCADSPRPMPHDSLSH